MPSISIIIPVFNTEKYIRRCLDSVCIQSFKEIEIIVVNDGSTDGSLDIINEYCKFDKRIRVINKKNGGQSSARNVGIEIAEGEYIGFVDSDDWIEKNMFEELYKAAKSNDAEIAICNHNKIFEDNSKSNIEKCFGIETGILHIEKIGINDYIFDYIRKCNHGCEVWTRIYKTDLIKKNSISFVKNNLEGIPEIAEDLLFNLMCCLNVVKIAQISLSPYNYLIRDGSSMQSQQPKLVMRVVKLVENFEIYANTQMPKKEAKNLANKLLHSMLREDVYRFIKFGNIDKVSSEFKLAYDIPYLKETLSYGLKNIKNREGLIEKLDYMIFSKSILNKKVYIYAFFMRIFLILKHKTYI